MPFRRFAIRNESESPIAVRRSERLIARTRTRTIVCRDRNLAAPSIHPANPRSRRSRPRIHAGASKMFLSLIDEAKFRGGYTLRLTEPMLVPARQRRRPNRFGFPLRLHSRICRSTVATPGLTRASRIAADTTAGSRIMHAEPAQHPRMRVRGCTGECRDFFQASGTEQSARHRGLGRREEAGHDPDLASAGDAPNEG